MNNGKDGIVCCGESFRSEDLGLIPPPSLSEAAGAQLTFPPKAAVWAVLRYQVG